MALIPLSHYLQQAQRGEIDQLFFSQISIPSKPNFSSWVTRTLKWQNIQDPTCILTHNEECLPTSNTSCKVALTVFRSYFPRCYDTKQTEAFDLLTIKSIPISSVPKDHLVLCGYTLSARDWMHTFLSQNHLKHPIYHEMDPPREFLRHLCQVFDLYVDQFKQLWDDSKIVSWEEKKIVSATLEKQGGKYAIDLPEEFLNEIQMVQRMFKDFFTSLHNSEWVMAYFKSIAKLYALQNRRCYSPPALWFKTEWKKFSGKEFDVFYNAQINLFSLSKLQPLFYLMFLRLLANEGCIFQVEMEGAEESWNQVSAVLVKKAVRKIIGPCLEMSEDFHKKRQEIEAAARQDLFEDITGVRLTCQEEVGQAVTETHMTL